MASGEKKISVISLPVYSFIHFNNEGKAALYIALSSFQVHNYRFPVGIDHNIVNVKAMHGLDPKKRSIFPILVFQQHYTIRGN